MNFITGSISQFQYESKYDYQMSLALRKPVFCMCENRDADQPHGDREADQRSCSRHTYSIIPFPPKSETPSLWASSVAAQSGPCRTRSETPKTGLLASRLILKGKGFLFIYLFFFFFFFNFLFIWGDVDTCLFYPLSIGMFSCVFIFTLRIFISFLWRNRYLEYLRMIYRNMRGFTDFLCFQDRYSFLIFRKLVSFGFYGEISAVFWSLIIV